MPGRPKSDETIQKEVRALFRKQKKINEKASVKYDLPKKYFSTGDYASTGYYEYFR